MFQQWGIWLRHCLNGKQDLYELRWPSMFASIPVIVRRRGSANGMNGDAKKTR
jgi:dihydroceramidase